MIIFCGIEMFAKVKSSLLLKAVFVETPHILKRHLHVSNKWNLRSRSPGFVDYLILTVKGGNGGNGALMFTSEYKREFCGPDGGNGGNGAHVVIRASHNVNSLSNIPSVVKGRPGEMGASKGCDGKSADHVFVDVPVGTIVYEVLDGNYQKVLADLSDDSDFLVAARGGAGGRGNQAFLTNEQRAPAFAEKGGTGEQRRLALEMKLLADVGLIGLPNAGKSSLLNTLSRAHPKIASYPFTTLRPHVGMIELPDTSQVSIADLPGIIEGAHENRGLGIDFLRHIERCRALFYVIDASLKHPSAKVQLEILQSELHNYNPELLNLKLGAVIANKIDLLGDKSEALDEIQSVCKRMSYPIIPVSAKFRTNIEKLKQFIVDNFFKHKPRLRRD